MSAVRLSLSKFLLVMVAVGVLCLLALVWWVFFQGRISTDNAYVKADVTLLSPKVTGYVKEVFVQDNQQVNAGDMLLRIDDADYTARLAQAEAQVKTLQNQINVQAQLIAQAQANANRSGQDLSRVRVLVPEGAVSQKRLDDARAAAKANTAGVEAAKAQREVLIAQLAQAEAALKLAQNDVSHTIITAPQAGVIGNRTAQVGQLVRTGSALMYLIPHTMWVDANFKETQIPSIKPGQPAIVKVDALPGQKLKAHIQSLAPASGSEFSILPPENATGNFTKVVRRVPVKVVFDASDTVPGLRPGLSAYVTVDVR